MKIMHVKTPKGIITIEECTDSDNPGVDVSINGISLALIEFDQSEEKHVIRVWNQKDIDHDAEYKQIINPACIPQNPDMLLAPENFKADFSIEQDILSVAQEEGVSLTQEQMGQLIQEVREYDNSGYNEHILTLIREKIIHDKK